MKEAILKAIEGGWNRRTATLDMTIINEVVLLDPLFWQAPGKAMGWGEHTCLVCGYGTKMTRIIACDEERHKEGTIYELTSQWRWYWHRFTDHLAEGKDPDSFFQALLSPNK